MSPRSVCIVLFVLQVCTVVWSRPSDTAGGQGPLDGIDIAAGQIVDRNVLLNGCPSHGRPHTMPSPQQLAGDWCGLENTDVLQNATGTSSECGRTSLSAEGENLRVIYRLVKDTGEVIVRRNVTFTRLPNAAWLIKTENKTTNWFIGFAQDQRELIVCGTTIDGDSIPGGVPQETYSVWYTHCLSPQEDPAERRDVVRCDLPPQRS